MLKLGGGGVQGQGKGQRLMSIFEGYNRGFYFLSDGVLYKETIVHWYN